ncbi:MAG: 16S rRNA (guanine(966)-N(2))-methyltransferase RsmD [Mycoplasmatales bacterium]|nr:16S rRNA (guanine(966)-N(2))-methyltransferase RsmD [Mycoplasmatales bacterium]
MLRVIGGLHGGRKLKQPDLNITRPTTDRAKEAVFSMIQFKVSKSIFLDLYSGSGSIGIEASSRGAMKVISVEENSEAIKIIKENIETLKINNISVVKSRVNEFLKRMSGTKFDFIYMDPPYQKNQYNETIKIIKNLNLLKEQGLLIIETSRPEELEIPESFVVQKNKKYGKTSIIVIGNNI